MRIAGAGGPVVRAPARTQLLAPDDRPARPAPVAPRALPAGWTTVGRVTDPRLSEISGVAASRAHPGVLWVHNDSGDGARVFAIGSDGAVRGEVRVDGARAADWEDISLGPGPAGSTGDWVYVADTGNNFLQRGALSLYRFAEPAPTGDGRAAAQRLDVRFDDGRRHNVEAMLVDPRSGDVLLVTKTFGPRAQLFRVPAQPFDGSTVVAQQIALLDVGAKVTGADVSPDGSRLVVRTRERVTMWERGAGEPIERAVARAPVRVAAPDSEAIAFSADGSTWFSIGEGARPEVHARPVPG